MKNLTLLLVYLIVSISLISQTPQAFKYQAVVRDNLGDIIANQEVSFRISIHDSIPTGLIIYQETHNVTTNDFGVANLVIGDGDPPITGFIKDIDWGTNEKFMEVDLDPLGNTAYVSMGTTQLLAVPYSLYAESTGDTSRWKKADNDLYYIKGKVGIGTSNPQVLLDVKSSAEEIGSSIYLNNSNETHWLQIFGGRGGVSPTYPTLYWQEGDGLRFGTYGTLYTERMRISELGNVGIGTTNPDPSALLEVNSNTQGFLLPRLTSEEISNIQTPADGLQVYNSDNGKLYIFVNSLGSWQEISYGISSLPTDAMFEIGTGGSCNNTVINGLYETGNSLTTYEFVTIEVNVLSVGDYLIATDTINGINFSDSGTFTSEGIQTIDLKGGGMPIIGQIDIFTAAASDGGGFCTFTIAVQEWNCGDSLFDLRDTAKYNTTLIGTQCWMAQNLNTGIFIYAWNEPVDNGVMEKYCYDDLISNCDTYGGIYNWNELMQYQLEEGVQGICPPNWHIPTNDEWCIMENEVDEGEVTFFCDHDYGFEGIDVGLNLKSESGWYNNGNGLDLYGFTGLPGGFFYNGNSYYIGERIAFWTSSINDDMFEDPTIYRMLFYDNNFILNGATSIVENDFYVRCIRD